MNLFLVTVAIYKTALHDTNSDWFKYDAKNQNCVRSSNTTLKKIKLSTKLVEIF